MTWQEAYLSRYYNPRSGFIDGTSQFHSLCEKHIPPRSKILEIGAGPTNQTSKFLSQIGELHGVDIDPDVSANSALRTTNRIENDHYPFLDHSFDACVSNYVLEHVEYPDAHLAEVKRVLKPGGTYVFRTPNRYHYVAIISSHTPLWFHRLIANRLRNLPRDAHDPYPTFYRFNDERKMTAAAKQIGMEIVEFHLVEKEPSYGMSSRLMFLLLMGYERTVNFSEKLRSFRSNILAVFKTPEEQKLDKFTMPTSTAGYSNETPIIK